MFQVTISPASLLDQGICVEDVEGLHLVAIH
jgi:hypothetical protein